MYQNLLFIEGELEITNSIVIRECQFTIYNETITEEEFLAGLEKLDKNAKLQNFAANDEAYSHTHCDTCHSLNCDKRYVLYFATCYTTNIISRIL